MHSVIFIWNVLIQELVSRKYVESKQYIHCNTRIELRESNRRISTLLIHAGQSWILASTPWMSWILDSNRYWDSGLLDLYFGFQSPAFRIPIAIFSWIPDSTRRTFPNSRAQLFEGRLALNPGSSSIFSDNFLCYI